MHSSLWLRVAFYLLAVSFEGLALAVPSADADGLPLVRNHLTCAKTVLKLTTDKRQSAIKQSTIALTQEQKNKLNKQVGYAPRKVSIITPVQAKGTCTCEMANVAVLSDAATIEVPHFLLASNRQHLNFYGDKACNNCVWGYINKEGKWVVRPQYVRVFDFEHGIGKILRGKYILDDDYGFVDSTGKAVAEKDLPKLVRLGVGQFHEGLTDCWDGKKLGFVDEKGRMKIPARFAVTPYQSGFYEGLSAVGIDFGKWGFIDKTGKFVIPPKYFQARQFHDGLAAVGTWKDGHGYTWAFIDHKGRQVGPVFNDVKDFQDGFAIVSLVSKTEQAGVMSKDGKLTVIDAWELDDYQEGLMGFVKNGLAGFMDKSGKVVIQAKFAGVGKFSEGLAPVILNDQPNEVSKDRFEHRYYSNDKDRFVGFIDRTGELVIPARFRIDHSSTSFINDEKSSFKNGLAVLRAADGKFGAIDKAGRWVIKPTFVQLNQFFDGLAAARIAK